MSKIWKVAGELSVGGEETLLEATWRGEYDPIVAYLLHDTVSYLGSSYICIFPCTGIVPTDITHWELVVEKGDKGDTGANSTVAGPTGSTGSAGSNGSNGTNGATGSAGSNGSNGTNGKTVWNGVSDPTTGNPTGVQAGDFYVNTTTHVIFGPYTTSWPSGISLVGPTGSTGSAGATGSQGIQGIQGTTGAAGAKGDTGSTGAKGDTGSTGAAGSNGTNGTNGTNGKTLWSGAGTPTTGLPSGVQTGDFYLNTTANTIYGPYSAGWGSPTSLVGATGAAGSNGTNGTNGAAGATGATGPGVATGGSAAQVLAKIDATNFNTHWVDPAAGGGDTTGLQTQLNAVRPFAAPVVTATVTVSSGIDHTGATDVTAALQAVIDGAADGSIISFFPAGTYKITSALTLDARHNLIIDGNGCTLKYYSVTGTDWGYSHWYDLGSGSDIWIKNFVLIGSSPYPGVYHGGTSPTGGEHQMGVLVRSDRFEVSGCTTSLTWGDGFYVGGGATDVWIHDNHVISAGRNGLSVVYGANIIAERNAFDAVGWAASDNEPNGPTEFVTNSIFRNNTIGTRGHYFFVAVSSVAAVMDRIIVDGNTVTGGSLYTDVGMPDSVAIISRVKFINNTSDTAAAGPVLNFINVAGLTVSGNIQPLSSGVLVDGTGSTSEDEAAFLSASSYDLGGKGFVKEFTVEFPTGVANQKFDIYWTGSQSFNGLISVEVLDTYHGANASGYLRKIFGVETEDATIYTNVSKVTDVIGHTATEDAISEFSWNAANSRYKITIVHRTTAHNYPTVRVSFFSVDDASILNVQTVAVSAVYTTDTTVYGALVETQVNGPASATAGHLATYGDTTGKVIADGGAAPTGSNTGDQNAAGVSIADAGGIITGTNVETALQENRTAINLNTAKVTNASHTGDVTGSAALTIAAKAVTLADMADLVQDKIIGRATASTGVPEVISCTAAGRAILDDANAAAQLVTLLGATSATAAELNTLDGITATTAELNITDGVTATAAELNVLDGITATVTELNYTDGVTSAIQTQLAAKAPLAPAGATYTPATGAQTIALDVTTTNMHVVSGHASGTAITFSITGASNNQPFVVSILQGGTTVSTIAAWFATVRWAGGTAPTLTATLNKRDTFGFIRTGADTYDGFVIGQNA